MNTPGKNKFKSNPAHTQYVKNLSTYVLAKISKFCNVQQALFLGSASRDTYYPKPKDLDFFLYYETLQALDLELLKTQLQQAFPQLTSFEFKNRGFPYVRVAICYAQRTVYIDFVPCIKESVDCKGGPTYRTKLHELFLQQALTAQLKEEIRKLKYYLKRTGLYGADSHYKGFSGYCCQVLIWTYKSIANIPDTLGELIDPVDPARNLLASVSRENLRRFVYLKNNKFKSGTTFYTPYTNLYCLEQPPLKVIRAVKKDKNVFAATYFNNNLVLEVTEWVQKLDPFTQRVPWGSPFYKQTRASHGVYHSKEHYVYKKHTAALFLQRYPGLKKVEFQTAAEKKLQKSYHYFK